MINKPVLWCRKRPATTTSACIPATASTHAHSAYTIFQEGKLLSFLYNVS